jgi:hypothetical protein
LQDCKPNKVCALGLYVLRIFDTIFSYAFLKTSRDSRLNL